jgi:hypothetical protein
MVKDRNAVTWNRATKAVVMLSTVAAALMELYLESPAFPGSAVFTALASIGAIAVARWARRWGIQLLLGTALVAPAIFMAVHGADHFSFEITWVAPLLILLIGDRRALDWSLPPPYRLPLVVWALIVSVSWPIVLLREVDFSRWLLMLDGVPNTGIGVSPSEVVIWLAYVTLCANVGVLWVDALYRWFGGNAESGFERQIVWPLIAGAAISCGVGFYQGMFDITFLSGHVWPHMRRATGTLMDANAFGAVAALMGPVAVVAIARTKSRWVLPSAALAMLIAIVAVWVSGSRSALAAVMFASVVIGYENWRQSSTRDLGVGRRGITAAVVIAVLVVAAAGRSSTATVFNRIPSLIPGWQVDTPIGESLWAWWQRNGYGTAAMRMIAEYPWQGVGIGSFHTLVRDYSTLVGRHPLSADNAQNWYRHQFAELGLLGSGPWIVWCALLVGALWTARGSDRFSANVLRSALVAFGLIALTSVPGQSMAVILIFWTVAYWFLAVAAPSRDVAKAEGSWRWAVAVGLVAVHGVLTLSAARGDLLPRHRADRFGWDYSGGISDLEPSGNLPGRRWTGRRSMSTIPVKGRVLKFVGWIDHPDADEHPVRVRVVADHRQLFDGDLRRTDVIRLDIPAASGARQMVLETWISRTFRPSDRGSRDRRDLGLAIQDWQWE